jgi:hypothetical protein
VSEEAAFYKISRKTISFGTSEKNVFFQKYFLEKKKTYFENPAL